MSDTDLLRTFTHYKIYERSRNATKNACLGLMKNNLASANRSDPRRIVCDSWLGIGPGFKSKRQIYKSIGAEIAQAIKDEDGDELIEAMNRLPSSTHRQNVLSRLQETHSDLVYGLFVCPSCGGVEQEDNSQYSTYHEIRYCDTCVDARWVLSEIMDSYINRDEASNYYESRDDYEDAEPDFIIARSRAGRDAYEHNGQYFSNEAYYDLGFDDDDDGDDDDDDDSAHGPIGDYHSSKRKIGHIPSDWDNHKPRVLVGIELEVEAGDGSNRVPMAHKVLETFNVQHKRYCACERDGSLNSGFEMVTSYGSLDMHREVLLPLKEDPFKGKLESDNTSTCGLHVTLDKADMTPFHAAKLIAFVHSPANKALIKCVARRYGSESSHSSGYAKFDYGKGKGIKAAKEAVRYEQHYAKIGKNKASARRTGLIQMNADRYEAVNFQNENLIEFRMYRGSLDYQTVLACMEMSYAMWHFSAKTGMGELTDEAFCKFLALPEWRGQTKILRTYLQEKGHPAMLAVEPLKEAKAKPAPKVTAGSAAAIAVETAPAQVVQVCSVALTTDNTFCLAA